MTYLGLEAREEALSKTEEALHLIKNEIENHIGAGRTFLGRKIHP